MDRHKGKRQKRAGVSGSSKFRWTIGPRYKSAQKKITEEKLVQNKKLKYRNTKQRRL